MLELFQVRIIGGPLGRYSRTARISAALACRKHKTKIAMPGFCKV